MYPVNQVINSPPLRGQTGPRANATVLPTVPLETHGRKEGSLQLLHHNLQQKYRRKAKLYISRNWGRRRSWSSPTMEQSSGLLQLWRGWVELEVEMRWSWVEFGRGWEELRVELGWAEGRVGVWLGWSLGEAGRS